MPRLTVTLTEEQAAMLEEKVGEGGEYASKSEAVRKLIRAGERVPELEREVDRLKRELRAANSREDEHTELVRYVEEEVEWRRAPLKQRVQWWLFGKGQ